MWVSSIWALSRHGGESALWLVPVVVASALWALLEFTQRGSGDDPRSRSILVFLRYALAWVGLSIASLIVVKAMEAAGVLAFTWANYGRQVSGLMIASGFILFGNALPTLGAPRSVERRASVWQPVRRFVGWTLTLTGLAIGASWVALDPTDASRATNRLLALCFVLVVARQVMSLRDRSATGSTMR